MEILEVVLLNVGFISAALSLRHSKRIGEGILGWVAVFIPSAIAVAFFVVKSIG